MKAFSFFSRSSLFIILLLFSWISFGQQSMLITTLGDPESSLSSPEMENYQKVIVLGHHETITPVTLASIADVQVNGSITFNIPGYDKPLTAELERIEYNGPQDYTWAGNITNIKGDITLIYSPEGAIGSIHLEDAYYMIHPLSATKNALTKFNGHYSPATCGVDHSAGQKNDVINQEICKEAFECYATVDVLVLVNEDAKRWLDTAFVYTVFGQMYIRLALESVATAMANSDIGNINFRYAIQDFDFTTSTNVLADIGRLQLDASEIRDQSNADLVLLLTNQPFATANGGTFGIAFVGPGDDLAYGIVEVPFLVQPRYTFAHELGHMFGAHHDRLSPTPGPWDECPHAFIFNDTSRTTRRTILATLPAPVTGLERIPHYSNPDVQYRGSSTGTLDDNNAGRIKNTKCMIADYREGGFNINILGDRRICIEEGYTLLEADVGNVFPGQLSGFPPYTYEWRCNSDGIFDGSEEIIGTSSSVQVAIDHGFTTFFVQLQVTSVDRVVKKTVARIKLVNCFSDNLDHNEFNGSLLYDTNVAVQEDLFSVSFSPNPTTGKGELKIELMREDQLTVRIMNVDGSLLSELYQAKLQRGLHLIEFDLSHLSMGIYYLEIQQNNNIGYLPVVLSK